MCPDSLLIFSRWTTPARPPSSTRSWHDLTSTLPVSRRHDWPIAVLLENRTTPFLARLVLGRAEAAWRRFCCKELAARHYRNADWGQRKNHRSPHGDVDRFCQLPVCLRPYPPLQPRGQKSVLRDPGGNSVPNPPLRKPLPARRL